MAIRSGQAVIHVCMCVFAGLCVFYMRAHAVMSSCVGERPRDANERGQRTTRTDVLTAQFLWEPAPTHPLPSPSHYHQHIPPPSIAPHCSCKSLTSSSNASRFVFMRVQAFLVELSHQLQLNLSPPIPPQVCMSSACAWVRAVDIQWTCATGLSSSLIKNGGEGRGSVK